MEATSVHYTADNTMDRFYDMWNSTWLASPITHDSFGYRDFKLHTEFPMLKSLHLDAEMSFNEGHIWTRLNRIYWWASILAVVVYLVLVFGGQRLMRNRKPFHLKSLLAGWNLLLAVFSAVGTIRLVPHLLYGLTINHHTYFFCRAASESYGQGPAGLWANMFVWSKFPELLDTAFLVLRKKPISFLHAFHHTTVLTVCWFAGQYQLPIGIFVASINYVIHSIMYFYYFLHAIEKRPKWGRIITQMQIAQMFIAMCLILYHYRLMTTVRNCDGSYKNITSGLPLAAAYLVLFTQFYISRYVSSRKRSVTSPLQREVDLKGG